VCPRLLSRRVQVTANEERKNTVSKILVTGGSGFVGGHLLRALLQSGHDVVTPVRNSAKERSVRNTLSAASTPLDRLSFVMADLMKDEGWADAVRGCDFVLHVASPFAKFAPKSEDEFVAMARDGTLRVLRAARDAAVKRVVVTSSFAAVGYGHPPRERPFTEDDWTDLKGADIQPYIRSKVIAERSAWDFIREQDRGPELAVVNPVGIFGPVLGPELSGSVEIIQRMLAGAMPACPRVYFGVVDVRDVVDLHIRAMTDPKASGQRFLAVAGESLSMSEVAKILRARLGETARLAPHRQLPDWVVRLSSLFKPELRQVVPQLGKIRRASSQKAQALLGWRPRSSEDAIAATGESLVRLKLVKTGQ
jgi:dihydroflavonol-4-reductase